MPEIYGKWNLKNPQKGMRSAKITQYGAGYFGVLVFFHNEFVGETTTRFFNRVELAMRFFKKYYSQYFRDRDKPEWELQKETTC